MIVSVVIQIWVFIGSQVLKNEMRSFRIPTRIDGCAAIRGNITNVLNATTYTLSWNTTTTTATMTTGILKTIVKSVLK